VIHLVASLNPRVWVRFDVIHGNERTRADV
jgi:hypothetical protein